MEFNFIPFETHQCAGSCEKIEHISGLYKYFLDDDWKELKNTVLFDYGGGENRFELWIPTEIWFSKKNKITGTL